MATVFGTPAGRTFTRGPGCFEGLIVRLRLSGQQFGFVKWMPLADFTAGAELAMPGQAVLFQNVLHPLGHFVDNALLDQGFFVNKPLSNAFGNEGFDLVIEIGLYGMDQGLAVIQNQGLKLLFKRTRCAVHGQRGQWKIGH